MKKLFLTIVLCTSVTFMATAETDQPKKALFQFSFCPPVGTNGLHSAQYTNGASLNLLVGLSKNEQAFTLSSISTIVRNDAHGVQIAGLTNYVGNMGIGLQIAGLTNTNRGNFDGAQIGGLVNSAKNMRGWQISCLSNVADEMEGWQLGGLLNIAQDAKGLQFGGLLNIGRNVKGVQFGGLMNIAKNVDGLQFAGLMNVAKDIDGLQFAGLVNVAKDVDGVQFAPLVNVARNSDWPIGLLNLIKNGEKGIAVTYDGMGSVVLSLRTGGKYSYGIIGAGYHKYGLVAEAGYGIRIIVADWFRINNELKCMTIGSNGGNPVFTSSYSFLPAFRIGKHFELFGGPSINYLSAFSNEGAEQVFFRKSIWRSDIQTNSQQVSLGYQAGIQVLF